MEWPHILLLCGTVVFLLSSSAAVPATGKPTVRPPNPLAVVASHGKPVDGDKSGGWQAIQDAYFALTSIREQLDQAREQLQEAYDNNDYDAAGRLAQQIRELQQQLQEAYGNLTALTG